MKSILAKEIHLDRTGTVSMTATWKRRSISLHLNRHNGRTLFLCLDTAELLIRIKPGTRISINKDMKTFKPKISPYSILTSSLARASEKM